MIATNNFALDQTHTQIGLNRLMKFGPPILTWLFIHDDIVSRTMTSTLACSEYVHFLSYWAQLLDKLKRTLTSALLARWMCSFWLQLTAFHCYYINESWASLFDKLLSALTSFDLSSSFWFKMEWLMLYKPHVASSSWGTVWEQPVSNLVWLFHPPFFVSFLISILSFRT